MQQLQDGTFNIAQAKSEASNLITTKAEDTLFCLNLKDKLSGNFNATYLKYFLWTMDIYSANPPPRQATIDRSTLTIEHIQPQNLVNDQGEMDQAGILDAEDIQKLGNLCLLTREENASLSDNRYSDKRVQVAVWISQNKHLTCALSRAVYEHHQSNDWTTSDIENREDSITQHACKVFSF